jgi:hypothetical protein
VRLHMRYLPRHRPTRERGNIFLGAAILAPMAFATLAGIGFYADLIWTKTRLADSARMIAQAIQDDPGIAQGSFGGTLGDLDRVVLAATGNREPVPAGFNVSKYKSCNPDLAQAGWSDDQLREHFVRAGAYEGRPGVFGDCSKRTINRDTVVNIKAYGAQPTSSDIATQFPYHSLSEVPEGGRSDGWHPSGRIYYPGQPLVWNYANPNPDPTQPYWISVVAKKPVRQLSLFGFTFGTQPEVTNYAVVRVVPKPPLNEGLKRVIGGSTGQIRGVAAINQALEEGILVGWGDSNARKPDRDHNLSVCRLGSTPTDADIEKLFKEPGCAHRFCNGKFPEITRARGNPVTYSLMGNCGVSSGNLPESYCQTEVGAGVPMVEFGCMWFE